MGPGTRNLTTHQHEDGGVSHQLHADRHAASKKREGSAGVCVRRTCRNHSGRELLGWPAPAKRHNRLLVPHTRPHTPSKPGPTCRRRSTPDMPCSAVCSTFTGLRKEGCRLRRALTGAARRPTRLGCRPSRPLARLRCGAGPAHPARARWPPAGVGGGGADVSTVNTIFHKSTDSLISLLFTGSQRDPCTFQVAQAEKQKHSKQTEPPMPTCRSSGEVLGGRRSRAE